MHLAWWYLVVSCCVFAAFSRKLHQRRDSSFTIFVITTQTTLILLQHRTILSPHGLKNTYLWWFLSTTLAAFCSSIETFCATEAPYWSTLLPATILFTLCFSTLRVGRTALWEANGFHHFFLNYTIFGGRSLISLKLEYE